MLRVSPAPRPVRGCEALSQGPRARCLQRSLTSLCLALARGVDQEQQGVQTNEEKGPENRPEQINKKGQKGLELLLHHSPKVTGSPLAFKEVTVLQLGLLDAPDCSCSLFSVPIYSPEGAEVVPERSRTLHPVKQIGWCVTLLGDVLSETL